MRKTQKNNGYEFLQGKGTVRGHLIGGCIEVLEIAKGLIFGKPYDYMYYEDYKKVIIKVIRDELKLYGLPIVLNMNFGHDAPIMTIPYGAVAEIDCDNKTFSILDSGIV